MRAATKRLLWSLIVGSAGIWHTHTTLETSTMPLESLGAWFVGTTSAFAITRIARHFPTPTRQEWDLGWGLPVARAICIVAIVVAGGMLVFGLFGNLNREIFVIINLVSNASIGLLLGALLGCGGVLGVPEDAPNDVPLDDSTRGE